MVIYVRLVVTTVNPENMTLPKSPGLQKSALMNSQSVLEQLRENINEPWRGTPPDHFGSEFPTE
jgi:hypothetical protein